MREEEKKAGYFSELLYNALVRSTDDFIYVCDPQTNTFRYPEALVELLGLPGEVITNPLPYWRRIVHPEDWENFYESNMKLSRDEEDSHLVEFRVRTKSGEYIWVRCRGQMMRNQDGKKELFAGIMSLMGKRNKVDSLTQLLNYEEFRKKLEMDIKKAGTENVAVMEVDIDEFHQVNELYSRSFGDKILKLVGQMIQALLPDNASLYRIEKDKMGILAKNMSRSDAEILYGTIQEYLRKIQERDSQKLNLEISAGCAVYPENGKSAEELCRHADYALQYAKERGKNQLVFFTEQIQQKKSRALELLGELKEDIEQGYRGFYLVYQPQVNPRTEEITGVETLVRWKERSGAFVSPVEFIPILEENRLIYYVGLWILRTALREGKEWIKEKPDFHISVNISALQLMEEHFLEDLYTIIEEEQFPCENLVLELTESYAVKNMEIFREKFKDMRRKNICMALDDFGTGYSSLAALKNTPVDIVKIDRAFVKDILSSEFDAAFIRLVVQICHTIQMEVCLEGVETKEEHEFLKDTPLDYIQGYYFGKPVSREEITKILERERRKVCEYAE